LYLTENCTYRKMSPVPTIKSKTGGTTTSNKWRLFDAIRKSRKQESNRISTVVRSHNFVLTSRVLQSVWDWTFVPEKRKNSNLQLNKISKKKCTTEGGGGGAGNFSHHRFQTGAAAHPSPYPMGTMGSFPRGKAAETWSWPLTSI
jgi:hypothetical protein